jgi:WD40 repeat protein
LAVHGDKLISGSKDHTIKVWSTDTWTCEHTLEGHNESILKVHGGKLISGSNGSMIRVWGS